jgi:hypothetical protein
MGQILSKGEIIKKNVKMGWGLLKIFFSQDPLGLF